MAGIGEIVQKPIQTCDKHSSDEVEVYCKDCSKAICFECSRIHHHGHECEGISKLSRTLRQQIPELCKEIREGTLSRMQTELESIQSLQIRNKKLQEEELNSMEMLQEKCMQAVKHLFKVKVKKSSETLCKQNEKLNTREQELIQKITQLNLHLQAHEDSQSTYGKYEIIEMHEKLREMTRRFDEMDIKESVYIPHTMSLLSLDVMERLENCLQEEKRRSDSEFSEDTARNEEDSSEHDQGNTLKLEFTEGDGSHPSNPIICRSIESIQEKLDNMMGIQNADNEAVFDWIERNCDDETTKSKKFIRALMTSVCQIAITGSGNNVRVVPDEIKRRGVVLTKFFGNQAEFELQALYALHALVHKLGHPPGMFRTFFDTLYDEDIISEYAFNQWEKSTDSAEQEGKGEAMKQVVKFFTWLREAEDFSDS